LSLRLPELQCDRWESPTVATSGLIGGCGNGRDGLPMPVMETPGRMRLIQCRNETFVHWQWAMHEGSPMGEATRIWDLTEPGADWDLAGGEIPGERDRRRIRPASVEASDLVHCEHTSAYGQAARSSINMPPRALYCLPNTARARDSPLLVACCAAACRLAATRKSQFPASSGVLMADAKRNTTPFPGRHGHAE